MIFTAEHTIDKRYASNLTDVQTVIIESAIALDFVQMHEVDAYVAEATQEDWEQLALVVALLQQDKRP